jgi:four helix bundle protein
MSTHKDLDVWRHGVALAKAVYLATQNFPKEEMYGLISQMRRSAVSIPSNIAEGAARQGDREFIQFLYMALGSASELDTQLEISKEIGIGELAELAALQDMLGRVSKMLQGLIKSVKQRSGVTWAQFTSYQSRITRRSV